MSYLPLGVTTIAFLSSPLLTANGGAQISQLERERAEISGQSHARSCTREKELPLRP